VLSSKSVMCVRETNDTQEASAKIQEHVAGTQVSSSRNEVAENDVRSSVHDHVFLLHFCFCLFACGGFVWLQWCKGPAGKQRWRRPRRRLHSLGSFLNAYRHLQGHRSRDTAGERISLCVSIRGQRNKICNTRTTISTTSLACACEIPMDWAVGTCLPIFPQVCESTATKKQRLDSGL
jgi:hypothetical protein